MTSFRATFGLTRSIGGWEEGERRERNKRKRQQGRTGAGQRGEWQLNEQREEINIDVEEREENLDVEEREKERERGCHSPLCPAPVRPCCLFRLFLSLLSPSSQPPIDRVSPKVALKLVTKPILFEPAEWSERLTPGQSAG